MEVIHNPYFDYGVVRNAAHFGYTKYYTRYLCGNIDIGLIFNQKNILNFEDLICLKEKIQDVIDKQNNNLYIICNNLTLQQ